MATARLSRSDTKARTRADLIAAARQVFLARGFHAAPLDEIAERAGYTKGAVYSNFRGKDDLFLALLAEHYARRAVVYEGLFFGSRDAEETYRSIARVMLDAYRREPAWWGLVSDFTSHAARDPELYGRLKEARAVYLNAVAGSIEALCERNEIAFRLPAREVARGVGALMRGMTVEWAIDPSPAGARTFEEMLAAYLRGLAVPLHEGSTA